MTDDPVRGPHENDLESDRPGSAAPSSAGEAQTNRFRDTSEQRDRFDESPGDSEAEYDEFEEIETSRMRSVLRNMGACIVSTIVHMVILIVLGLIAAPLPVKKNIREIVSQMFEERPEDLLQEIELDTQIEPAENAEAVFASAPQVGVTGGAAAGGAPDIKMNQKVVENFTATEISIGSPITSMPSATNLVNAVPEGTLGEPRAIVDNYQQAFDRMTQEILWMLDKSDVMVIWVFDQSLSMKDDQKEIRDRIEKVYSELGLIGGSHSEHLLTAVTSYGAGHFKHTVKPTGDLAVIRQAINAVPVDVSGKEMMCEAVSRSLAIHREYARRYQLMMVIVTDESGDQDNNVGYLERAIAEAKAARCRIYALSRESVFGYPYARIRWKHPQTNRHHWLPIDRGPETGFVEQLQTNGFHRRYDAFPAGFAPYELGRMTRETGGVFFMLPSTESNLVRGNKRKYELEQMRAYRPDLRARIEVFADRDKFPLRTFLWQVISDLNPYNKDSARVVELQMEYPINLVDFTKRARLNQQKAIVFIKYLAEAQKVLEQARSHREQEADPRWQANYDLIYAQTVAYQARLFEYGVALEEFMKSPKVVPRTKTPNLTHLHWDCHTVRELRTEESKPYVEKSKALFAQVIAAHPGTPWAARAKWEMARGFGVDVRADYHPPYKKVSNPIPVPKY
jgi:hypothetical protein